MATSLGTSPQLHHSLSVPETGNYRSVSIAGEDSSSGMILSNSSPAFVSPGGDSGKRAMHPDHQVQPHSQLVLLGGGPERALSSEVEQLQITKSPSHPQQMPRNASHEKDCAGGNDGSGLPVDNELVLRGERRSKPSIPSSSSPGWESRLGGGEASSTRPTSPIRATGGACGCSRSEKRPDCSFEHCGAAVRLSLCGDGGGETDRAKSPVFKMERRMLLVQEKSNSGNLDDEKPPSESSPVSRQRGDGRRHDPPEREPRDHPATDEERGRARGTIGAKERAAHTFADDEA